jgi:hypothetical protein
VLCTAEINLTEDLKMDILIDFDGTCVTHAFPEVGIDIGAKSVLKKLISSGHRLILFTMRANRAEKNPTGSEEILDVTGNFLDDAVNWFKERNIPLYGIQTNPTQKQWTTSPKAYGHMMIDDSALGCPLDLDHEISDRPFVDWKKVELMLIHRGIIE